MYLLKKHEKKLKVSEDRTQSKRSLVNKLGSKMEVG
jgi:hypothetical protein